MPKGFYPEIHPNAEHMLEVDSGHQIYVASYGNPAGIPIIALHGGPGSGTEPYYARFFDPGNTKLLLLTKEALANLPPKVR